MKSNYEIGDEKNAFRSFNFNTSFNYSDDCIILISSDCASDLVKVLEMFGSFDKEK